MNYSQKANPNATNSELDAKKIVHHVTFDDYQFAEDDSPEVVLTDAQRGELIEQYVELHVDSMDVKSLMQFVTDTLIDDYSRLSDDELKVEIECTHDEELYTELVDNVTYDADKDAASYT